MAIHVKEGFRAEDAFQNVRGVVIEGRNPIPTGFVEAVNHYANWINRAEMTLKNYFSDPRVWTHLRGDGYWHIHDLDASSRRWSEMIHIEMRTQADAIAELEAALQGLIARRDAAPGRMAVLDTNVLLHYEPPWQIPWPSVIGVDAVRLVLPIRVVEELDEKKWTARTNIADRARRLLSQLHSKLSATAGMPASIADNVTIEVPVDAGPRERPLDADFEVMTVCRDLRAIDSTTCLVTADTALSIRATHAGLRVVEMPEKYERRKESE